jgi:hypothetical protein
MPTFTLGISQNEYLPAGGTDVNAIVTVEAIGGTAAAAPEAAEIVIIDVSGSMGYPRRSKIEAARDATIKAIECIRDGVWFAVIAGTDQAREVYPGGGQLVRAATESRAKAARAVTTLDAEGGTAIGSWLRLANQIFATHSVPIAHAILLTDGQDEDETPAQLDAIVEICEGNFQCDCRGVGTDWEVNELRRISSALLGTVDILPTPADIPRDFQALMQQAMSKATADVALRLWTPRGAETELVKQVAPVIEDLSAKRTAVDELTGDYPTGAWGNEARDYHLCIKVSPGTVGEEMLAGRIGLVVGGVVAEQYQGLIRAIWTDDVELSTRLSPEVAHYTGQEELADAVREGIEARQAGDEETATQRLGRAVQLAAESGNDATLQLLEQVVDIEDLDTGTVRLKPHIEEVDEMALDTRSTKSAPIRRPAS